MILIQQDSLGSTDSTQQLRVALKTHKNGNTPYNTSKGKNNIIHYIQIMNSIFLSKNIMIDDINTRKQLE